MRTQLARLRTWLQLLAGVVSVASVGRTANKLLLDTYLDANASSQTQSVINTALDQLQNTVGDTDSNTSPAALISALNTALVNYSAAPQNNAVAATVVTAAQQLAASLNSASQAVTDVRNQADSNIATSVANINNLLSQFQALNQQVVTGSTSGADITDVLDARDSVLKQLSTEVGIRTVTRDNGDMAIYTDSGVTLFDKTARKVTFQQSSNPFGEFGWKPGLRRWRPDCGNQSLDVGQYRKARRIGRDPRQRRADVSKPAR